MIRKVSLMLAAVAFAISAVASPALAARGGNSQGGGASSNNGNGNGNSGNANGSNGNGNGGGGKNGGGGPPTPTPAPAPAPAPTPTPSDCGLLGKAVVGNSIGCAGFFAGNIFNQNDAALQQQASATLGATFGGDFGTLASGSQNGSTIVFGQRLYGVTVVGMHFGNIWDPQGVVTGGQGNARNVSVLWKFDFGIAGADGVSLNNARGWSNAVLYRTGMPDVAGGVPEPAAWALLVLGFGTIGASLRRARRLKAAPA